MIDQDLQWQDLIFVMNSMWFGILVNGYVLISCHLMRASNVYVPFIFIFKWANGKTRAYLFFLFLLIMRNLGGSIFFRSFDINLIIWLLAMLSIAIHWFVLAFFFYMPRLITSITYYMTRKGSRGIIIFLFHIPSIAINSFVTKYVASKAISLKETWVPRSW